MRLLYFLFMIAFFNPVYAQPDLSSFASVTNLQQLDSGISKFRGNERLQQSATAEMEFGWESYFRSLHYNELTYHFLANGKKGQVHALTVVTMKYDHSARKSIIDTVFIKLDTAAISSYLEQHNTKYNTELGIGDFIRAECGIYGSGCGIVGMPQASFTEMISLVRKEDRQTLRRWASAISANDRIHGTVGLYLLKSKGLHLTEVEEKLVALNKKSNAMVNYCAGCIFGLYDEMKNLLADQSLKYISKSYRFDLGEDVNQ